MIKLGLIPKFREGTTKELKGKGRIVKDVFFKKKSIITNILTYYFFPLLYKAHRLYLELLGALYSSNLVLEPDSNSNYLIRIFSLSLPISMRIFCLFINKCELAEWGLLLLLWKLFWKSFFQGSVKWNLCNLLSRQSRTKWKQEFPGSTPISWIRSRLWFASRSSNCGLNLDGSRPADTWNAES